MTIRTMILDDDTNSHKAAVAALREYPEIQIVGQFTGSDQMLAFLETNPADLLFLDIELKETFGFTVARQLRQRYPGLMIVFLTGHSSYAIDGYDFQPVNFLTKPIHPVKLEQTIREVRSRMERSGGQRPAQIMFRLQQGYRILDVREIVYIERKDRKNILHTEQETVRIAGYTMRELEEMLCGHGFFLCHQSFLISLHRVKSLCDVGRQLYETQLQGCPEPIPVSRNRYEAMKAGLLALGIPVV